MSVDRIKAAIEKIDRGLLAIERRAEAGAFDRMQDRRERQRQREKELRDRAKIESEERQRSAAELEALNRRHEEALSAHEAIEGQLRNELDEQGKRIEMLIAQLQEKQAGTVEAPESERFGHLKHTHKGLKRKHETLSVAAADAVARLDEIIGSATNQRAEGGGIDG